MPNPNYWFSPIGSVLFSLAGLVAVSFPARRWSFAGAGYLLPGAGALAFYVQNIWASDWRLWRWYFYPAALIGSVGLGVAADLAAGLLGEGPGRPAHRADDRQDLPTARVRQHDGLAFDQDLGDPERLRVTPPAKESRRE